MILLLYNIFKKLINWFTDIAQVQFLEERISHRKLQNIGKEQQELVIFFY